MRRYGQTHESDSQLAADEAAPAGKSTRVEARPQKAGPRRETAAPPAVEGELASWMRDEGLRLVACEPESLAELRERCEGAPPLVQGSPVVAALQNVDARFPRVGQSFAERWHAVLSILRADAAEVARWIAPEPQKEKEMEKENAQRLRGLAAELETRSPSARDAVLAELTSTPVATLAAPATRQRAVDQLLAELRKIVPDDVERVRALFAWQRGLEELRLLVAAWHQRWSEAAFVERTLELAAELADSERAAAANDLSIRDALAASKEAEKLCRALGLPAPKENEKVEEVRQNAAPSDLRQAAAGIDEEVRRLAEQPVEQRRPREVVRRLVEAQREAERRRDLEPEAPAPDEVLRALIGELREAAKVRTLLSPLAGAIERGVRVIDSLADEQAAADGEALEAGVEALDDEQLLGEWSNFSDLERVPAAERKLAASRFTVEIRPERREELERKLPAGRERPVLEKLRQRLLPAAARQPIVEERGPSPKHAEAEPPNLMTVAREQRRGSSPSPNEAAREPRRDQPRLDEPRPVRRVRLRVPVRGPQLCRALSDWTRRRPTSLVDEEAAIFALTSEERAELEAELLTALRMDRPPGGGERESALLEDAAEIEE